MPRNTRNFWIELEVDDKKEGIATGPRCKDGGFNLTIKMRDKGEIITALRIMGTAEDDELTLTLDGADFLETYAIERKR